MKVIDLKLELERLCFEGKSDARVMFVDKPFESELIEATVHSIGNDTVSLTRA